MANKTSIILFAVIAWAWGWANLAHAQLKLEPGEKVKVMDGFRWLDGKIVKKQGAGWIVEYMFSESYEDSDLFARSHIRKLCEVDALDFVRSWQSSNGKFKIDAALKGIVGDLEEVLLVKTDLTEIRVEISSLSEKDVAYVTKFQANRKSAADIGALPAVIPALPDRITLDFESAAEPSVPLGGEGDLSAIGELPDFLKTFQQEGVGFQKTRINQTLVATIPVGGPDQLVLITTSETAFFNKEFPFQAQGYWVSLTQKKVVNLVAVTPEMLPIDYDPRHKLLLTVRDLRGEKWDEADRNLFNSLKKSGKSDSRSDLDESEQIFPYLIDSLAEFVLWRLQPGDSKVEPLIRWRSKLSSVQLFPYAKIINSKIVLTRVSLNTYQAWNLETKQEAYSFKVSRSVRNMPVITPDRQNIIVSSGNRVSVLKAETGETRFALSVPEDNICGVNVNSSGTKLAAITTRSLYVWELGSTNREPQIYPAPLISSPDSGQIFWIDDDHVLIEGIERRVLYRLSLKLPIWSYVNDVGNSPFRNHDPLLSTALAGMFFYVAEPPPQMVTGNFFQNVRHEMRQGIVAVGAVKFPGPKVNEVAESAIGENTESLYVLKPGVNVDIKIGSVTDPEKIRQWLLEKIEAVGWVYQAGSSIVIRAEMGVLPTRTESYRQFGRSDHKTTTVSLTPHFALLQITDGDKVLWHSKTVTGVPFFLRSNDLQNAINEQQKPQLQFFETAKLDPVVMDPEYSNGFGISKLGMQGIEVISVTPPGRADDPWDAAQKLQDDIDKSSPKREHEVENSND